MMNSSVRSCALHFDLVPAAVAVASQTSNTQSFDTFIFGPDAKDSLETAFEKTRFCRVPMMVVMMVITVVIWVSAATDSIFPSFHDNCSANQPFKLFFFDPFCGTDCVSKSVDGSRGVVSGRL